MHHHVANHDGGTKGQGSQLPAQSRAANGNNRRVVAEYSYNRIGESEPSQRTDKQEDCAQTNGKPEPRLEPFIQVGTVAKTADGLESLPQTDDNSHDKHANAVDNRHACNGSIAVIGRSKVQHHG